MLDRDLHLSSPADPNSTREEEQRRVRTKRVSVRREGERLVREEEEGEEERREDDAPSLQPLCP